MDLIYGVIIGGECRVARIFFFGSLLGANFFRKRVREGHIVDETRHMSSPDAFAESKNVPNSLRDAQKFFCRLFY